MINQMIKKGWGLQRSPHPFLLMLVPKRVRILKFRTR